MIPKRKSATINEGEGNVTEKCTIESYSLAEKQLPSIPEPHDAVIRSIALQDGWLILSFEDDISLHDCVRAIHPNAWTLEMKIHLLDEDDIEILAYEKRKYESVYVIRKPKTLFDLAKKGRNLEYLYHRVYHKWIQLELCGITDYIVRMYADKVLMEWHER